MRVRPQSGHATERIDQASAILLVTFSRPPLGAHDRSDVGAAFAEGVAWCAIGLRALAVWWRNAGVAPDAHSAEQLPGASGAQR